MNDETIFATALEKDPAERNAYLEGACQNDPEQRKRIEALLAAHDSATGFLERPVVSPPDPLHAPTHALRVAGGEPGDGDTRSLGSEADDGREDALGFLAPPGRPDSLGRLGRYEILEVLGKGGFGIVFRAFDDVLQRVVAVKMLSPSMAATSPARKRFIREARSSGNVHHENVVQVHDIQEQPLPYLVMEFIPGETLQQRLDRTGPLEVSEVLRIGRQVAEGLAAAHATGLIHRDIKPSNILIDSGPQQHVKITDFGLARAADDASLTRSGVVAGTPMYMAPEQAKGETLDHRADLFSLGSVMYAMLTGRPPFRAETTLAVLKRVAEDDPRPIREVIPEVAEWMCRIVEKLHAKNPAERFEGAREVADLLADCEQQLQAHKELRDTSRIPNAPPPTEPAVRVGWPAIAGAALLLPVTIAFLDGDFSGWISIPAAAVMGGLNAVLVVGFGQKLGWIGPEAGGRPRSAVRRWTWTIAALVLALIPASVWFGRAAMLYAADRGELELLPEEGLVEIIVLKNDEGIRDENKLHPAATDWLGMKERHRLRLPPGTYQLNAGAYPAGTSIPQWEVRTSGPLGGHTLLMPGEGLHGWSVIVKVERGKRTTVRPVIAKSHTEPQHPISPSPSVEPIAGWGTAIDPKRDCRFESGPDGLTITVPGGKHNLNPTPAFNDVSAPRVLRKAEGDFELEVTVGAFSPPAVESSDIQRDYLGAGLLLWQDERNFVRFVRAATAQTGRVFLHLERFRDGRMTVGTSLNITDGPTGLRVTRNSGALRFYWSTDGKQWQEYAVAPPTSLTGPAEAGVCAINTTGKFFPAVFTKLRFRPAGEAAVGPVGDPPAAGNDSAPLPRRKP